MKPYCVIKTDESPEHEDFTIELVRVPATARGAKTAVLEKWALLSGFRKNHPGKTITGYGSSSCALCELYLHLHCDGCPISQYTGYTHCKHTPFDSFNMNAAISGDSRRFTAASKRMLAFLEKVFNGVEE